MEKKPWFVYIIKTEKDRLYTGITTDLARRFKEHLGDFSKGAKFFRSDKPEKIVYSEPRENRSSASIREAEIKRLTRKQKEDLILESNSGKNIVHRRRKVQSKNLARSTRITKKRQS
jgi:putative endonuclease